MPNKRIIDLTAAGGLASTDLFEIDTGVASFRVTSQQIYNLILTLLAAQNPLQLTAVSIGSGAITLNTNGSAVFANNKLNITNAGNVIVTDGTKGLILTDPSSGNQFRLAVDVNGQIGTFPFP